MTISDQTAYEVYTTNGISSNFVFNHPCRTPQELTVTFKASAGADEVTWVYLTNFTVSGTPDSNGNYPTGLTVVASSLPAAGGTVAIERSVNVTQSADYTTSGKFPAATHEGALDKLTMIAQDLKRLAGKAIRLPSTTTLANLLLPTPQAGKFIGWNTSADGLENLEPSTVGELTLPSMSGKAGQFVQVASGEANFDYKTVAQVLAQLLFPAFTGNGGKSVRVNAGATAFEAFDLPTTPSASDIIQGIVELATPTEAKTGTDTVRAVTPAGLKAAQGMQFLGVQSVTNQASIDFTGLTSAYDVILFFGEDIVHAAAGNLAFRVSESAAFKSGASDYEWATAIGFTTAGTGTGLTAATNILMLRNVVTTANTNNRFMAILFHPSNTGLHKGFLSIAGGRTSSAAGTNEVNIANGSYIGSTNAIDGARFYSTGGNISGTVYAFGLRLS